MNAQLRRVFPSWPPLTAVVFGIGYCGLASVATLIALGPEPQVPEGSYALIHPSDGPKNLRRLLMTWATFIAGVLFLAAMQADRPRRAGLAVLGLVPLLLPGEIMRTFPSALLLLSGSLLVEGVFWRLGHLPAWWLGLRIPMTVVLSAAAVLTFPFQWP